MWVCEICSSCNKSSRRTCYVCGQKKSSDYTNLTYAEELKAKAAAEKKAAEKPKPAPAEKPKPVFSGKPDLSDGTKYGRSIDLEALRQKKFLRVFRPIAFTAMLLLFIGCGKADRGMNELFSMESNFNVLLTRLLSDGLGAMFENLLTVFNRMFW